MIGRNISEDLQNVINDRRSVVVSRMDGGTIIPIIDGDDFQSENQIIVPVIAGGDCFGSLVVFDKDKSTRFGSGDVKFVQLGATFLSKQFE